MGDDTLTDRRGEMVSGAEPVGSGLRVPTIVGFVAGGATYAALLTGAILFAFWPQIADPPRTSIATAALLVAFSGGITQIITEGLKRRRAQKERGFGYTSDRWDITAVPQVSPGTVTIINEPGRQPLPPRDYRLMVKWARLPAADRSDGPPVPLPPTAEGTDVSPFLVPSRTVRQILVLAPLLPMPPLVLAGFGFLSPGGAAGWASVVVGAALVMLGARLVFERNAESARTGRR